jgi:hypothetical protein
MLNIVVYIYMYLLIVRSKDSSVSMVTGFGLECLGSIPSSAGYFSSPQRPDQLQAHPAYYPAGTKGSFHGRK